MKKYQSNSNYLSQISKKRPSIEFSPTLEKPIYIIAKNLNGLHIIHLIQQLDKHKIPYQMQQETQTLGFKLNQRFFIIVDNRYGEVTLGAQFGSILMTVVGYPRIGNNKKNKYFQRPIQIIKFYQVFKNNKDISQREKSLIHKQYSDIILEKESSSKLRSKIVVRSISKYKNSQKNSLLKVQQIKQKKVDRRLIMIQDTFSDVYSHLCNEISLLIPKESIFKIQKVEQVRQLTLFSSNKAQIYYLVNQRYEKELLETIFVGEVLVFISEIAHHNFKSSFTEPKIYGITSQQKQIMKMLHTIGLIKKEQSQQAVSKLPQLSLMNSQISQINAIQTKQLKQKQKQQKVEQSKKPQIIVTEVSRIEGMQSVISEQLKQNDLNISIISQTSTKSRRKVKRINKSKKKESEQTNTLNQYYLTEKKQNQVSKPQSNELRTSRKKTLLRTQEKQSVEKPKKSLKFVDFPKEEVQIKRLRSISRFQPKKIEIVSQSNATMTQNEYFPNQAKNVKSSVIYPQFQRVSQVQNKSSTLQNYLKNSKDIDAIFYRQFIQNFKSITESIKQNPSCFSAQTNKSAILQPFFNMTQFDRYARKIKRKLKEGGHNCQQFKFVAFIIDQELAAFEKYCFEKNKSYQQQGYQMESLMKASNFSSTFGSVRQPKIIICLFIQSNTEVKQKMINYGTIKIIEFGFPAVAQFQNLQKPLCQIRQKLIQINLLDNREYFHS